MVSCGMGHNAAAFDFPDVVREVLEGCVRVLAGDMAGKLQGTAVSRVG